MDGCLLLNHAKTGQRIWIKFGAELNSLKKHISYILFRKNVRFSRDHDVNEVAGRSRL